MAQQLFLSHDHRDSQIANTVSTTIKRITLSQLNVWHSSDGSGAGGIKPGDVWLDEIRSRLLQSRTIIPLLTPNSISKPWLLFEAGFGAAHPDSEIVPVCLGLDRMESIPFPLAMYQCYLLTDYESLKRFCSKLLGAYEIHFDEDMSIPVLEQAIGHLAAHDWKSDSEELAPSLASVRDEIKRHFDMRLFEYIKQQPGESSAGQAGKPCFVTYSVPVHLKFPGLESKVYLDIQEDTTIEDVLDNIYVMIRSKVSAFSYLQEWLVRETTSNRRLIIREFQHAIPGSLVFTPETTWECVPLQRPYSGLDSANRVRQI